MQNLGPTGGLSTGSGAFGGLNKPFSDYREASPISPYMNLYRQDNSLGTVNNYYSLVKPQIDQRNANRRMGSAIRGLQSTTRALDVQTRGIMGTSGQRYHMNYGGYYPGFGR